MDSAFGTLTTQFDEIVTTGKNLVSNVEGRLLWLEMLKALDAALPKDTRPAEERKETAEDVTARNELHIMSMDCEWTDEVGTWYAAVAPMIADAKTATFRQKRRRKRPPLRRKVRSKAKCRPTARRRRKAIPQRLIPRQRRLIPRWTRPQLAWPIPMPWSAPMACQSTARQLLAGPGRPRLDHSAQGLPLPQHLSGKAGT